MIVVRPVRREDAADLVVIRRRPAVARNIYALPSERQSSVEKFIDALDGNGHLFVAELDGRVVGMAGLHGHAGRERHVAHVGIMVHDDVHGRGVGRALMQQLLDVADRWLGLIRVELVVNVDNERAIRLYESLGFVNEGRQRKAAFVDGDYRDVLMMARVRE